MNIQKNQLMATLAAILMFAVSIAAQTTAFNYQGSLKDGGTAANGSFQMQFKLFDTADVGTGTVDTRRRQAIRRQPANRIWG